MELNDMNDKFFQDLFGEQMNKIKEIDDESMSEIQEAHEIITKLLFAWETGLNKRYGNNDKITEKALNWLNKNTKISKDPPGFEGTLDALNNIKI
tara:strand:- start:165 stop:449 length:285 start_codon:yes stop_codon:yes gene_type:complete